MTTREIGDESPLDPKSPNRDQDNQSQYYAIEETEARFKNRKFTRQNGKTEKDDEHREHGRDDEIPENSSPHEKDGEKWQWRERQAQLVVTERKGEKEKRKKQKDPKSLGGEARHRERRDKAR